jgi:hypothetical protein
MLCLHLGGFHQFSSAESARSGGTLVKYDFRSNTTNLVRNRTLHVAAYMENHRRR